MRIISRIWDSVMLVFKLIFINFKESRTGLLLHQGADNISSVQHSPARFLCKKKLLKGVGWSFSHELCFDSNCFLCMLQTSFECPVILMGKLI